MSCLGVHPGLRPSLQQPAGWWGGPSHVQGPDCQMLTMFSGAAVNK